MNGEVTKLDDLANPDKVGTARVGMIEGDMPDFVMINLGIDPTTSGPAEWQEAADWLRFQQESGTVRSYGGNDYLTDLQSENTTAAMAWSGDVLYSEVWLGFDMEFVFPDGGALLWIDNMMIPAGAQNPVGAMEVMDFYYDPEVATKVTEWVLYMSPVPATQESHRPGRRCGPGRRLQGLREQAVPDRGEPVPVPRRRVHLAHLVRA